MSSTIIRPVVSASQAYPGYFDVIAGDDALLGVSFTNALAVGRLVAMGADLASAERDVLGEIDYGYEGPTCSICDAVGHGYPGGGPCPLEMRGEDCPPWAM